MARNNTISIAKGIGISLVVIGHSGCPKVLHDFIYLFHMALFYFVAGYCYKELSIDRKLTFLKKRIKGLYLPYVKYGMIFLFLHNFLFYLNIYNNSYGFHGRVSTIYNWYDIIHYSINTFRFAHTEQLLGAFWFLRSLFIVSILFCFLFWLSKCLSKRHSKFVLLFLVLCILIIGGLLNTFNISGPYCIVRELIIVSIFYTGFVYRKYEYKINYNIIYLPFCILILLAGSMLVGTFEVMTSQFIYIPYFIIISLIGCYTIMLISFQLKVSNIRTLFIFIGNKTLYILAFHFISFKILSMFLLFCYDKDIVELASFPVLESIHQYWWIGYSLIGIGFPLLIQKCFKLVKTRLSSCNMIIKLNN